jgi:hypothetical protein
MTTNKTKNWMERCIKENAERMEKDTKFFIGSQRMTDNGIVNRR